MDDATDGPGPEQGVLFDGGHAGASLDGAGFGAPTACAAAGITYRQLDYWARTQLVVPSVRGASGSGSQRLYSFRDILVLRVVKKLLGAGVSLQNIRAAVQHLRDRGIDDLTSITLMSDGATIYECTSNDEVIDLLQNGQAVFAIAVGRQVREVEGTLAALPRERVAEPAAGDAADDEAGLGGAGLGGAGLGGAGLGGAAASDELAVRRRRRTSA